MGQTVKRPRWATRDFTRLMGDDLSEHVPGFPSTFVIAHRLSTIRRAEQILVVEDGRIVERGTHDSLYAAQRRYYDLYTRQHGIDANLFLAPGEGDKVEEGPARPGTRGVAAPTAASLLRGGTA